MNNDFIAVANAAEAAAVNEFVPVAVNTIAAAALAVVVAVFAVVPAVAAVAATVVVTVTMAAKYFVAIATFVVSFSLRVHAFWQQQLVDANVSVLAWR